jgi:hypothetical protein
MINSRKMRWAGHVAQMGETRNAYRILVGKPEGKRPLVIPRHMFVSLMELAKHNGTTDMGAGA